MRLPLILALSVFSMSVVGTAYGITTYKCFMPDGSVLYTADSTACSHPKIFEPFAVEPEPVAQKKYTTNDVLLLIAISLSSEGIKALPSYDAGTGDDFISVAVLSTGKSVDDTLGSVHLYTSGVSNFLPKNIKRVVTIINGKMYLADLANLKTCLAGAGVTGIPCTKKHIKKLN